MVLLNCADHFSGRALSDCHAEGGAVFLIGLIVVAILFWRGRS